MQIKDGVVEEYNIPRNYLDDRDKKDTILAEFNKTPRDLCILYAKRNRDLDEHFFTKVVMKKIEGILKENPATRFVIADTRFTHEVELMKTKFPTQQVIVAWVNGSFQSEEQAKLQQQIKDTVTLSPDHCDIVLDNRTVPFDGPKVMQSLKSTFSLM